MSAKTVQPRDAAVEEYSIAAAEMRRILVSIQRCLAVEDEVEELLVQLDRLETAGAVLAQRDAPPPDPQEQVRAMAETSVAAMPIAKLCQDRETLGIFAAEIVRQILDTANQCQTASRKKRQADGIAAAKANGVRFGRQKDPLPSNFEEARSAWRGGQYSLRDAAKLCGMSSSSFYRAVLRSEEAASDRVPIRQDLRSSDARISVG